MDLNEAKQILEDKGYLLTEDGKSYGVFEISFQRSVGYDRTMKRDKISQVLYFNGIKDTPSITTRRIFSSKDHAQLFATHYRFQNRDERKSTSRLVQLGLWSTRYVVHEVIVKNGVGIWTLTKKEMTEIENSPEYAQSKEWYERNIKSSEDSKEPVSEK